MNKIKEIRELRGLDRKELAEKIGITTMGLYYIETSKRKSKKWLPKLSKVLDCTPRQLLGLEPLEGLGNQPEIEFKEQYVKYAIDIISHVVEAEDLTPNGRAKLLAEVYKMVYDFFENDKKQEYFENLTTETKQKLDVAKGVLDFIKTFNKK